MNICAQDGGKVCTRILSIRIARERSENVEPLREKKRDRIKSVAKPSDVERSEAEDGGAERLSIAPDASISVADVPQSGAEASASVRTPCSSVLTKPPQGAGKQNYEPGLKLAHFTIDESMPVPELKTPGPHFLLDETRVKSKLTWDYVKSHVTSYCYQIGYPQPSNRSKAFAISSVLLTVLLKIRPGELRTIRWRDLKAQYVAFPDSRLQKISFGTLTERVLELIKSWRTDAELDQNFVFDFTERTLERIVHRILGGDVTPRDLRRLREFHVDDNAANQWSLVKSFMGLRAGTGLRSGELFRYDEERHTYNTALEHGFAHPDPKKTRQMKMLKVSGYIGKRTDSQ